MLPPRRPPNSGTVAAMAEKGIDISDRRPAPWTSERLEAADVVVTMGCGDTCPLLPGKRYVDWVVEDPSGEPLEDVKMIRGDIKHRVQSLLAELVVPKCV
jgi:protein-tyrosine-phosphatase